ERVGKPGSKGRRHTCLTALRVTLRARAARSRKGDWQIAGGAGLPPDGGIVNSIADQTAGRREVGPRIDRRNGMGDASAMNCSRLLAKNASPATTSASACSSTKEAKAASI